MDNNNGVMLFRLFRSAIPLSTPLYNIVKYIILYTTQYTIEYITTDISTIHLNTPKYTLLLTILKLALGGNHISPSNKQYTPKLQQHHYQQHSTTPTLTTFHPTKHQTSHKKCLIPVLSFHPYLSPLFSPPHYSGPP